MTDKISAREIMDKLSREAGITKKMAAEILRAIPGIIEEGLEKDGEVRVKGLGTFRLKQVKSKIGRNPRTGERVNIPAHNKIVFFPEQSFKEFINQPNRMLEYQLLDKPEEEATEDAISMAVAEEPVLSSTVTEITEEAPVEKSVLTTEAQPVESEYKPASEEPTSPPPRKRGRWIILLTLAVIIILSLIFYFRNCYHSGAVLEDDQSSIVDSQESLVDSQESLVDSLQPEIEGEEVAAPSGIQEPETQEITAVPEQAPVTVTEGKYLFRIAREVYDNPYLWVLIYQANQDQISDPEQVIIGRELKIPSLEGSQGRLSKHDSLELAKGYRLVYEYYMSKGDAQAEAYRMAMVKYQSE